MPSRNNTIWFVLIFIILILALLIYFFIYKKSGKFSPEPVQTKSSETILKELREYKSDRPADAPQKTPEEITKELRSYQAPKPSTTNTDAPSDKEVLDQLRGAQPR